MCDQNFTPFDAKEAEKDALDASEQNPEAAESAQVQAQPEESPVTEPDFNVQEQETPTQTPKSSEQQEPAAEPRAQTPPSGRESGPSYGGPSPYAPPYAQGGYYPPQPPRAPYPPYAPPQSGPYGAPQGGYYPPQPPQPPQPPRYPQQNPGWGSSPYRQPYYPPVQPAAPAPREKLSTGVKVFLWIVGALIGALVIGFVSYGAYTIVTAPDDGNTISSMPVDPGPEESTPPASGESGSEPESSTPSIPVVPNTEGIRIESKTGDEKSAKEIYQSIAPSLVGIVATPRTESENAGESQGSGIIATADGYVITNAHVVLNTRNIDVKVIMHDDTEYDAVVVGYDKTTDLAVLKINAESDLVPAVFGDSEKLAVGDWVLAIGNPGGVDFSSSLTRGIVSAVNRKVGSNSENGMTYIQTDAAINPGNSGGALVNMYGQVIGINSSKIVASGYEGMGFAIPISKAKFIVDELMASGYVQGRTRLGIRGMDVSMYEVMSGRPQGFIIDSIDEDSAFSGTDAQKNDIITALDGTEVTGLQDITNILSTHAPGDRVTVTLYRQGMRGNEITFDVTITLLEDKGETQN